MGSVSPADSAPVRFKPHGAQLWVLQNLRRFCVLVCHRGWGKTTLCVNLLTQRASLTPNGRFAYVAPLYRQVKQAAWDALKYASHAPGVGTNESELVVQLPNEARVQLFGADNYDALRGMHLDGVVLDEYAQMNPAAWTEVIRPALAIKQGFAIFIGTPKGRNHFYELYRRAATDPQWLTALYRWEDSGVVAQSEIDLAKRDMSADEFAQEYECSFEAALRGAYYANELSRVRAEGRIKTVPWEPQIPVDTWWDLGFTDETAIVFSQTVGRELHVIDYLEASKASLAWYVAELQRRPYVYGRHTLPHDATHAQQAADGRSIEFQLRRLGLRPLRVLAKQPVLEGIHQARMLMARCWFDAERTQLLIDRLATYHAKVDDKTGTERKDPEHDQSSHGADAFRYMAIGLRQFNAPPQFKTAARLMDPLYRHLDQPRVAAHGELAGW